MRHKLARRGITAATIALGLLALAHVFAACGGDDVPASERATSATGSGGTSADKTPWSLVALGDSVAVAVPECDGCTSFVDLWADGLSKDAKRPVKVSNHAVPGAEASDVLDQVRDEESTRAAIKGADLIVVAFGINDTPWNRKDDPCDAAPEFPVIQWAKITKRCISRVTGEYGRTLDSILDELDVLRAGKPTVLRVITVYNAVIGDNVDPSWDSPAAVAPSKAANKRFASKQCQLAEQHRGACIDVHRAFNGARGSKPARRFLASDYTHPSTAGHKAIAGLLLQAGSR